MYGAGRFGAFSENGFGAGGSHHAPGGLPSQEKEIVLADDTMSLPMKS